LAKGQALRNTYTEAINGLCASVICNDHLNPRPVIMLTSASQNEGKTLMATQLAAGFARTGRKTLLIDCDFRNPRCHKQVGLPAGPGISEVLRGEAELAAAIQAIPDSEARILTAGQSSPQIVQALSNGKFSALLARLRKEFDCIIVDSAPTLIVSDGLLVGKLVDGVILVVRPKVSKSPTVFAAYEQLRNLNIPILGAVINGDAFQHAGGYYYQ
jgi:succinoglycan biosynthesis transport protein ExoP